MNYPKADHRHLHHNEDQDHNYFHEHGHDPQHTKVRDDVDHHHVNDHNHTNDYDNDFDIYPQEFLRVFNNGSSFNGKIIDVRESWEIEEVKIADSLFIPLQKLNQQAKQLQSDHIYYVICTQGFRSSYTAYLLSLGFENVFNIQTGLTRIIEHLGRKQMLPVWLIRGSN